MQKLNLFGVVPDRLVGVLYGHNGSGKVYNYYAKGTTRTGDIVTPDVTHYKSGKTYKTLGRVVYTRDINGHAAKRSVTKLRKKLAKRGKALRIKTLGPTDQKSLPNYYPGWGKMHKLNLNGE